MRFARTLAALAVLLFVNPMRPAAAPAAHLGLRLSPCVQGTARVAARCGTFGVYENRSRRTGRILALHLIVLTARHPSNRAIALIPGGPGQGAAAFAPLVADAKFSRDLDALRDRYDIVLLDSRGMGDSNPFKCSFYPPQSPQLYFRQLFPDMLVRACRRRVSAYSDPNQYRTVNAVDDLDDARAALGYPKLVLNGGSYGTYFSLVYLRRHPKHVESAVLSGVYAPHFQPVPGAPDGAQKALQDLITKCRQDFACRTHFPQFASHFASVIERFKRAPLPVPVKAGNRFVNVPLYAEVLVDRVRQALYDPQNAATIPFVFERAYRNDYKPLGDLVNGMTQALAGALDYGAFLSYTCADEVPFIKESTIRKVAARSFVGDLRVRAQQHACALWHVRPMPPAFDAVVRSSVPVLMIIGSDDPATPSKYSEQELPYLTRGFALIVRGAGHVNEVPCTDSAIVAFVRSHGEQPKVRCAASFTLPPFELK